MTVFQLGAAGAGVRALQARLRGAGFCPGPVDGLFGARTASAVRAFQGARGLAVDGVAGPLTLAALGLARDAEPGAGVAGPRMGALGYPAVRAAAARMFPAASAPGIARHLPVVLDALAEAGLDDAPMVLMALATIRAETESFRPVSERVSKYNTTPGGHPFDRYDDRADLGNRGYPDGARFRGRGFVQLTGRDNYTRHSRALYGDDRLVAAPDRANDPEVAARLLARFLKEREGAIRKALDAGDLRAARRLVNGGTHGLERFTDAYRIGARALGLQK